MKSRFLRVVFAAGVLLVLPAIFMAPSALAQEKKPALSALRAAAEKLRPLMQKKIPPASGDWLAQHPEAGQTFDQYLASNPNRPTRSRTTLYLQPIGNFSKAQEPLVKDTGEAMRIFFNLPVKSLDALPDAAIPASARRTHPSWGMKQFHTSYILEDVLRRRRPVDAVALLGLTATDLFPEPSWNFVFGQASLSERVGVWSLARYGDAEADYTTVLRRTLKVALHETGHMFGIAHCTFHECGMNGSNSLPETDRARCRFAPSATWNCGGHAALIQWLATARSLSLQNAMRSPAKRRSGAGGQRPWKRNRSALFVGVSGGLRMR